MRALAQAMEARRKRPRSSARTPHRKAFGVAAAVFLTGTMIAGPARATTSGLTSLLGLPSSLTVLNPCQAALCIDVDSTKPLEPATHQLSGIVHSMNGNPPVDPSRLAQLGVTSWRSSNYDWWGNAGPWNTAASQNIPVTYVLSDKWSSDTGGARITPWSDWTRYRNWVISSVQEIQQAGINVDYWDVYNEPDEMTTEYYPPAQALTVTPANLLTQFLVTYQAIRSVLPNAQVIGPSTAEWLETANPHMYSMVQFLDFAVANHMSLAAMNWHYNGAIPQIIEGEVAQARGLLAARPALGQPKIFINEFGSEDTQRIPGWDVQYLAALTTAGVDSAGRSCWQSDCASPVLDGLLASDGSSTLPDYWVRTDYAQMTGTMVATSSSSDSAAAFASFDPSKSQVRVLLGYGVGCVQDPRCAAVAPWAVPQVPLPTQVTVRVPWTGGHVLVTARRIAGTSVLPMSQPTSNPLGTFAITDQGSGPSVTIDLGYVADGDAWSLALNYEG